MFDVNECREALAKFPASIHLRWTLSETLDEIERLQETIQMYCGAIDRSDLDLSCCIECGEPVVASRVLTEACSTTAAHPPVRQSALLGAIKQKTLTNTCPV